MRKMKVFIISSRKETELYWNYIYSVWMDRNGTIFRTTEFIKL